MLLTYLSQSTFPSPTVDSIQVMRQCAAFTRAGHTIRLLAPDKKDFLVTNTVPAIYYGQSEKIDLTKLPYIDPAGSRLRYLFSTWGFMRQIKKKLVCNRPELVYGRYLPGCVTAARLGIPTIYEAHRPVHLSRLENTLFKHTTQLPSFLGVTAISTSLKRMFTSRPELKGKTIITAHDAADIPQDHTLPDQWPGRSGHIQAGYAGSLFPGRGVELMEQLAKQLPHIDFHLIGGEPEDIATWQNKPTPPNMLFHGYVSPARIHRYRNACDILLAPYQHKVTVRGKTDTTTYMSPMKIFEYMASGRPMVVSDLPVLREVLSPKTALLVPPDDLKQWVHALQTLESPQARETLAKAARKQFMKHHTWDARASHILAGFGLAR